MDRSTLNKYKEEFIHWMNEGFIYTRKAGTNHKWEKLGETSKKLFRKGYEFSIANERTLKPGDFVRVGTHPGKILTVKQSLANIQLAGNRISKTEEFIEEWEPELNELCLFWNMGEDKAIVVLDRFKSFSTKYRYETVNEKYYDSIAPFIGINTTDIL